MGRILRCPACGQAHSFGELSATPTFPCTQCGRTLRTPTELVHPAASDGRPTTGGPTRAPDAGMSSAVSPGRSAQQQTPSRSTAPPPRPSPRRNRRRPGVVPVPLRLLAWVVAVIVGLVLAWLIASRVGLLSRTMLVDMFRSSTATNYWRLALFVPLWAFTSATSATVLIEGIRWFRAHRAGELAEGRRPSRRGDGDRESKRPALRQSVPDAVESTVTTPLPAPPPGRRTRIRPREATP